MGLSVEEPKEPLLRCKIHGCSDTNPKQSFAYIISQALIVELNIRALRTR